MASTNGKSTWLQTWLGMGKKEGLFEGMDLGTGMEVDVENTAFIRTFIDNLVYRRGYYGNLFAEGHGPGHPEMGL